MIDVISVCNKTHATVFLFCDLLTPQKWETLIRLFVKYIHDRHTHKFVNKILMINHLEFISQDYFLNIILQGYIYIYMKQIKKD